MDFLSSLELGHLQAELILGTADIYPCDVYMAPMQPLLWLPFLRLLSPFASVS